MRLHGYGLLAAVVVISAVAAADDEATYCEKPEAATARYLDARRQLQALTAVPIATLVARGPEVSGRVVEIAGKIVGRTAQACNAEAPVSFVLRTGSSEQSVFIDSETEHPLIRIGNAVHVLAEFPANGHPLEHYRMREIVLSVDLPESERNAAAPGPKTGAKPPDVQMNIIKQNPLAGQPPDTASNASSPAQPETAPVARPGTELPDRQQWGSSEAVNTWVQWVQQRNPKLTDLQARLIVECVLYYSYKFAIDHRLAFAMIRYESDFDPTCRSHAGAMGLTQLMPGTARSLGVANPWDIQQNIMGGLKYLSEQLYSYGSRSHYEQTILGLACYNAGPNAVKRAGGVPNITETQRYVKRVSDLFLQLYQSGMP